MFGYFLKRLLQAILVMIVVAFVSFSLFNFVGDPIISLTGEDSSIERQAEVREALGLNDPIYIQFTKFLGNVIQGDFGISYQLKREVSDLIAERMPATLELVFVSALLAIVIGVILGVYTGIHRDSFVSNIILGYLTSRRFSSNFYHRDNANLFIFSHTWSSSIFWKRRGSRSWFLDNRFFNSLWPQGINIAICHFKPISNDVCD